MNAKVYLPESMIKIDIRKAYDTVSWSILEDCSLALDFPTHFVKLIMTCVSSPSYSINVNGEPCG